MLPPKQVPFTHQDRQWDARFNVPTDSDLESLLEGIKQDWEHGKLKYILVGGIEIGTRPYQDDYQLRHVHIAAVYANRVSKSSILKHWNVKQGNGYYLVPRNRDLPYAGWRNHHIKDFSKIDKSKCVLYEMGTLPADEKDKRRAPLGEEEKKRKVDEILIDMREMIEKGEEKNAFVKYPRNYLIYGERLKAMVHQKRDFFKSKGDPHIWVYGYPGSGKTAILSFIYPTYFKKNLHNKFFDLYDPELHTHVMLEDLDYEAIDKLSINFIKTICDEAGFAVDQKYKSPQLARTVCLVTSNFTIDALVQDGNGVEESKRALYRRFWHINIYDLLRVVGLKLLPKWDRQRLKQEGNTDVSKLFMEWDYATDLPTGKPLRGYEDYQVMIRNAYYNP